MLELVCRTMAHDAHSSLSVVLPNAAHRLAKALATFWDDEGRPAVDGLDAGKRPPTDDQVAAIRAVDLAALDDLRTDFGVTRFVGGLDGFEALEALTFQTTLNVQGLWSGAGGGDRQDRHAGRGARPDRHPDRPRPGPGGHGRGAAAPTSTAADSPTSR